MAKNDSNVRRGNAIALGMLFTVCVGLFIRLIVGLIFFEDLTSDPDAYRLLAVNWAETGTFGQLDSTTGHVQPTAFRPPLYPRVLSWAVELNRVFTNRIELANIGVLLTHLVISGLTIWCGCWCVWHLLMRAREGSSNRQLSATIETAFSSQRQTITAIVVTGLFIALDPILLRQSTLVMTETLAALLSIATWAAWLKWSDRIGKCKRSGSVWFTVMLGISVLGIYCRPAALVWSASIAISILLQRRLRFRHAVGLAILFVLGIAIGLVPWILRNQTQLSRPIIATSHGGYTLLLANNDILYDHFESNWSRAWDEEQFASRWQSARRQLRAANRNSQTPLELVEDDTAKQLALDVIRERPGVFLKSCLVRLTWLWSLWPDGRQASRPEQILIGVFYTVVFLVFLLASVSVMLGRAPWINRSDYWPALGLVLSLSVVHAVFWSNMRMRSAALPLMHVCVGLYAVDWLAGFWTRRKMNSRSI